MSLLMRRSGSWRGLASLLLFSALLGVFLLQDPTEARERPWRGPHLTEDGWYYYHWLRSAALDGDLDLSNDYREFGNWYGFGVTATGRPHNPFGIGPAMLWAPGFTIGHGIAKLCAAGLSDGGVNGYSRAEQTGALLTSFLAAMGACGFAFALCRRFVSSNAAWLGTALAFLAGPVVWYAVFSPSMPHAFEALFGAAFLWIVLPLRERTGRGAALLGLVVGGMMLVRPQLAIFLVLPLIEAVQALRRCHTSGASLKLPVLQFATVLGVAMLVFCPQLWVWKWTYGSWFVVPQGSGFLRFADSLWSETLFSSRNGLFTVTPALWFVMPGLYLLGRQHKQLALLLASLLVMQAVVNGAVWDWWAGGAFGGRRFAATFPIWAIALSTLCAHLSAPGQLRGLRVGLGAGGASLLLLLQGWMLLAHHQHRLPWDAPLSFNRRVHIATGLSLPDQLAYSPFAFPANALFALQHWVPLSRYELAVGPYLLDERLPTTNPLLPRKRTETVSLSKESALAFYGRGFIRTERGAELNGNRGELLLPLNRPGSFTLQLDTVGVVDAEVQYTFNGRALARAPESEGRPEGRSTLSIEGAWVTRGINVLRMDSNTVSGSLVLSRFSLKEGKDWPPAWTTVYGL